MDSDAGGQPDDADLMAAVTELGAALRELVDASVRTAVPADELRTAAAEARAVTARLAAARRPVDQLPALDDPAVLRRVFNPVDGAGSALAPPLAVRWTGDGVAAEAALGPAYEGPPGYVHGGVSSLLMDQLLGTAVLAAGLWGMTARLELAYHRPVPLETPLVLRARVVGSRGRRTTATGSIALADDPDRPLVEAHGLWVTPREDLVADYFGAITNASGQYAPPGRPADAAAPADQP
ncbi:PaaI family thioesterase [Geodermatophilus sp. TF02-6]|uniref:PaaI family thioesterase n=1 Tax=Geodermatophilus sp. TF02-6 TaxID=2250575 RepID=UPI000DEB6B04|nr:PaaI family thioesterase [Geodermatophilus sp. TF02-6]RBY78163.1 PaaI family thioesterase [Geodermatophilus sp. TF02-6]